MDKKITIEDVAEALQVSKTTVSRALSGKGRVGAGTRDRILAYIEEHNYVPNAMAKALAQSRTYNIGITVPDDFALMDLPFFQKCLMGVCEHAGHADYDVLVSMTKNDDINHLERLINNRKVDGIVLTRTLTKDLPAEYLLENDIPFVAIGSSPNADIYQVDNDHEAACYDLTKRLIEQGIKRFALFCDNTSFMVTQMRMRGFSKAIEEYKLGDYALVFENTNDDSIDYLVDRVLKTDTECILCMDDSICIRVLDKLKRNGLEVPTDIKVASFYNSNVLERNTPSITSLSFDAKELGRAACEALLSIIEGEEVARKKLLGYEVSMQESTKTIMGKDRK